MAISISITADALSKVVECVSLARPRAPVCIARLIRGTSTNKHHHSTKTFAYSVQLNGTRLIGKQRTRCARPEMEDFSSLLVKFHGEREDLLAASLEQRRIGVRRGWILVRKLRMLMQSREFRLTFFETSWKLDTLLTNDLETSGRGNETSWKEMEQKESLKHHGATVMNRDYAVKLSTELISPCDF